MIKTGEVLFMKKEKERKNWRENLVTSLEVPGDLAMKETIITLTGRNHAVVCNYKSILRYQQEEIVVLGFHGRSTTVRSLPKDASAKVRATVTTQSPVTQRIL